ncbi:AAA family ATPase [Nesterenkonia natronophila]|uniref:MinD/ParA family protein n=1 Tax=Nesterenkonia natronophila TaxID=2174932 RepID=A0A3A4G2P5_9MICC|nr:P-loop NTPase [Nesterenkonia natronophila]RJN32459.1 MinD/ParA family protein [Nesterenkonia natronophila]
MIRIAVAGAGPDVESTYATAAQEAYVAFPAPYSENPADLLGRLNGAPAPGVIVLDSRTDLELCLGLAGRLATEHPDTVVLLITDQAETLGLRAMRAGVKDLVPAIADTQQVTEALHDAAHLAKKLAAHHAAPQENEPTGRVITVVSPKGGAGKTTVATNLAVALASAMPHSTVIVDLDLQFGDVATALNLTPQHFLPDVLQSVATGDTIAMKTRLTLHDTGLYVVPAPDHPAAADSITSGQVSQLLQLLSREFAYVVVDTSPGITDHTLGALDQTTDPILLTTLSVPGVSGLRKVVDTLSVLQMFTDHNHLVVNFADTTHGVSQKDVDETLGVPVETSIPVSKGAPASVNTGVPLMQSRARDPLVKALAPLASRLLPDGVDLDKRGRVRERKRAKT